MDENFDPERCRPLSTHNTDKLDYHWKQRLDCGFPQGSILGSLVFILLINDIEKNFEISNSKTYADSTALLSAWKTSAAD